MEVPVGRAGRQVLFHPRGWCEPPWQLQPLCTSQDICRGCRYGSVPCWSCASGSAVPPQEVDECVGPEGLQARQRRVPHPRKQGGHIEEPRKWVGVAGEEALKRLVREGGSGGWERRKVKTRPPQAHSSPKLQKDLPSTPLYAATMSLARSALPADMPHLVRAVRLGARCGPKPAQATLVFRAAELARPCLTRKRAGVRAGGG